VGLRGLMVVWKRKEERDGVGDCQGRLRAGH